MIREVFGFREQIKPSEMGSYVTEKNLFPIKLIICYKG